MSPEALEKADEKPPPFVEKLDDQIEVDLFQIELIVLEYALKGNVIIYGRGGQDLLKGIDSVFRVRIIAPFEDRVERWAEREWLDPDLARVLVRKSDQQRAGFIKYYFDRDWNDPLGYDLMLNTQHLSEETAVKLICDGVKDKNLAEMKGASKKLLSDLIIRKRVEIAILSIQDVDGHHVTIDVKDGVITLGGHVHSEKERRTAVAAAGECQGGQAGHRSDENGRIPHLPARTLRLVSRILRKSRLSSRLFLFRPDAAGNVLVASTILMIL